MIALTIAILCISTATRPGMVEHPLLERISLRGNCRAVGVSPTWLLLEALVMVSGSWMGMV